MSYVVQITSTGIYVFDSLTLSRAVGNPYAVSDAVFSIVKTTNSATPIVEGALDAQTTIDLINSASHQNWNSYTRDAVSAVLGTIIGIAALPEVGPAGSLILGQAFEKAFTNAWDVINAWTSNPSSDILTSLVPSGSPLILNESLSSIFYSGDPYSGDPFTGLPWAGQSYETLLTNLETRFQQAEVTRSPLVLDLDGDGVETTTSSKRGVHFDLDKSGFAEQAGWVGKDDGLLVRDLNGDGKITHGGELFGNHTVLQNGSQAANGFEALKDLDDNNDGKVDANDSAYASLRVWKDLNSDGITEDGELITLEQAGVQSLNVRYTDQGTGATKDAQGNQHQQLGSYTKADGSTQQMDDVWFSVDTARTVNLNTVAVSDEIAALPELRGMGNVASLRQAMAQDGSGELQTLVEQWVDVTSRSSRKPRSHKLCSLMSQSLKHQPALVC